MFENIQKNRSSVVAVIESKKKVLLLYCTRNNNLPGQKEDKDVWKLPQGGIESSETSEAALDRELQEELGINKDDFEIVDRIDWKYDFSYFFLDKNEQPVFEIKLYPFHLKLKKKVELVLDKSENSTYKWVSLNDVNKYDFSIRDEAYRNILREFFKL